MNNRVRICGFPVCVLLLMAVLSGCNRPPTGSVEVGGDVLYINGRIDHAAANAVVAADFSLLSRVVIDSGGGNVTAAFRIADKLRTIDIPLEIRGECMSVCASVILPASRIREMRQGSTIALHTTQYGLHELFRSSQQREGHGLTQSAKVAHLAKREYDLLEEVGVDPRLLMAPYVTRGDTCYLEAEQRNGEKRFAVATELAKYEVTTGTLAQYGMHVRTIDTNGNTVVSDLGTVADPTPNDVEKRFIALNLPPCGEQ